MTRNSMRLLTTFAHGSILLDDEHSSRVDGAQVSAGGCQHRVEPALGPVGDRACSLPRACAEGPVRLDDDDFPARELKRRSVNTGEAELEHSPRPISQQLEDARRCAG